MTFRPFGRLLLPILPAVALFSQNPLSLGQSAAPGGAVSGEEAAKRLQWLKSVEPKDVPQPTPAVVKKHFAGTRAVSVRPVDISPIETVPTKPASVEHPPVHAAAPRVAETHAAEARPKATSPAPTPVVEVPTTAPRIAETHPAAGSHSKATPSAASPVAEAHPTPSRVAEVHSNGPHSKSNPPTPSPVAAAHSAAPLTAEARAAEKHPAGTPHPQSLAASTHPAEAARVNKEPGGRASLETRATELHVMDTPSPKFHAITNPATTHAEIVANRYPWKMNIVTTVFWIGEPVGGNNFTPNCSSSWDSNWTRAYGGYDNPNPGARRNFIPVNFIPRQNPFYVALPYNDVTRGTTKPEARVVIPWFKEAYRREGQSVCRDRWVAIRSRGGKVGYAQWSDCGPFRTDHWQYVFGLERPKPNLNQGAGLDVSPALRDYLGLQSTDVTDWKFVEARDVPRGPWSLYGENNAFAQK